MVSSSKLFLALISSALCLITKSMDTEVVVNTTNGMIFMDSFVAHKKFYSNLQELIKNKVSSGVEDILAHSKIDITLLVPNIDVVEYTVLQILHCLAQHDLSFLNELVQSLEDSSDNEYLELRSPAGVISDLLKSNVVYSQSHLFKAVKSLMYIERDGYKTIPRSIVEGVMAFMNKSEIFMEASRQGDIDVMKWLLRSENYLDLTTALDTACHQKRLDIIGALIESNLSDGIEIMNASNCNKEIILIMSVITQSHRFLSLLIRNMVTVNVQNAKGVSPLFLAVQRNNIYMSKLLIEKGANINHETVEGNTALHEASRNGMVDIAELLINSGSNVVHKNKNGISPIMMSEKFVITNIIQSLFDNKVDIPGDEIRCLFFLIVSDRGEEGDRSGDINPSNILRNSELVNKMKSKVVHITDTREVEGVKAKLLNITMINLITPFVKSLINIGVRLDVKSEATKGVFLNAVEKGNKEMTIFLIDKGISVNVTRNGFSALHVAAINGRTEIFYLLIKRGADVHAVRSNGRTVLHSACEGEQQLIVDYLIKEGLNVNSTDTNGVTPLQIAASKGNYDVIVTLVKNGADVRFRSSTTALLAATISGNVKAVNFLLDNGADIEEKANLGTPPLIAAVNTGNEDVVNALLSRGASVLARADGRGDTALHIAAKKGSAKMVEMLLKRTDVIGVRNSDGRTPLDEAISRRHTSIISLLSR